MTVDSDKLTTNAVKTNAMKKKAWAAVPSGKSFEMSNAVEQLQGATVGAIRLTTLVIPFAKTQMTQNPMQP
jgi:hypothetical protein